MNKNACCWEITLGGLTQILVVGLQIEPTNYSFVVGSTEVGWQKNGRLSFRPVEIY